MTICRTVEEVRAAAHAEHDGPLTQEQADLIARPQRTPAGQHAHRDLDLIQVYPGEFKQPPMDESHDQIVQATTFPDRPSQR